MGKNNIIKIGSLAILTLFLITNAVHGALREEEPVFNVDKGAKKSYSFLQYLNEEALEDELEINDENGVQQVVTIRQGVTITIEVTDVVNNEIDYQLTLDGTKSEKYEKKGIIFFHLKDLHVPFLQQTIVNRSYWDTMVDEINNQYEPINNNSLQFDYDAEISGDLIIFGYYFEHEYNGTTDWYESITSFNWKTGWLNHLYMNYSESHEGKSLIEIKEKKDGLFGLAIHGYEVNLAVVGLLFSVFLIDISKKRK
ncbi:MAG: hypothetical protein ACFFFH_16270 [Candidatus Thorarchaeota archaeon]